MVYILVDFEREKGNLNYMITHSFSVAVVPLTPISANVAGPLYDGFGAAFWTTVAGPGAWLGPGLPTPPLTFRPPLPYRPAPGPPADAGLAGLGLRPGPTFGL